MKGLIIYKGKYGATAQYAKWIAEELKLPVHDATDHVNLQSAGEGPLILGTSVYVGKLQLTPWLQENLAALQHKKLFLFVVCGTPPTEKAKLESYIQGGLPPELKTNCTFFFLPGRLCISDLSWKDKFILKMGARLAPDPNTKKAMLTGYDRVKRENIAPLVREIRQYSASIEPALTA